MNAETTNPDVETVLSYLAGQAKSLLLDQDQNRTERQRLHYNEGVMQKITRWDQGEREGQITATLNALLVLMEPTYVPGPGFDSKRNDLRAHLLSQARQGA